MQTSTYKGTMEGILEILEAIQALSGKKNKAALIKKELPNNPLLKKVVDYALSQGRSYNITALNDVPFAEVVDESYADIFTMLDYLASKRGATQLDIDNLSYICPDDATRNVVTRIINRDLRIGADASTFNNVMPGSVYVTPYNRYSSFGDLDTDKLEGESLIVQLKNDGRFAYMQDPSLVPQGSIFCSRQGIKYGLHGAFEESFAWVRAIQNRVGEPIHLEGEMLVLDDTKPNSYLKRSTGNGLIEKFILSDGEDKEFIKRLRFIVWGYVTAKEYATGVSTVPYAIVWANLLEAYDANTVENPTIRPTLSISVDNYGEAMDFYRRLRALKYEGAMLKIADKLKWRNSKSGNPHGFKLKAEAEAEFEILDAYYGDKGHKWENHLGGIVIQSSDGKILSNIGGGFTDRERLLGVDWWKSQKGKIVTGKFTDIVQDKTGRTTYCLEHSRMPNMGGALVETRFSEKTEADTYEYCVKQLKTA